MVRFIVLPAGYRFYLLSFTVPGLQHKAEGKEQKEVEPSISGKRERLRIWTRGRHVHVDMTTRYQSLLFGP